MSFSIGKDFNQTKCLLSIIIFIYSTEMKSVVSGRHYIYTSTLFHKSHCLRPTLIWMLEQACCGDTEAQQALNKNLARLRWAATPQKQTSVSLLKISLVFSDSSLHINNNLSPWSPSESGRISGSEIGRETGLVPFVWRVICTVKSDVFYIRGCWRFWASSPRSLPHFPALNTSSPFWEESFRGPFCCTCPICDPGRLCGCRRVCFSAWVWEGRWRRWMSLDVSGGPSPGRRDRSPKVSVWGSLTTTKTVERRISSPVQTTWAPPPSPQRSCPPTRPASHPVGPTHRCQPYCTQCRFSRQTGLCDSQDFGTAHRGTRQTLALWPSQRTPPGRARLCLRGKTGDMDCVGKPKVKLALWQIYF